MRESLPPLEDSLARALCWGALWDMTRDAQVTAERLRATSCCAGSAAETDETAAKQLPIYAQLAVDQFAHPAHRAALAAAWEAGLRAAHRRRPSRAATTS